MGAFQRVYTEQQEHAFKWAVLEDEITTAEAMRLAAEGNLPDPDNPGQHVPAFKPAKATAYRWIQDERALQAKAAIRNSEDLNDRLDDMSRRCLVLAEAELQRQERAAAGHRDVHYGKVKMVASIVRTLRIGPSKPKKQADPGQRGNEVDAEPERPNLLQRLAETQTHEAQQPANTSAQGEARNENDDTDPRFVAASDSGMVTQARRVLA